MHVHVCARVCMHLTTMQKKLQSEHTQQSESGKNGTSIEVYAKLNLFVFIY